MTENAELKLHVEQEVQKRNLAQADLKAQLQEMTVARSTEKQFSKVCIPYLLL